MREIKFRGRNKDNKWYYGDFISKGLDSSVLIRDEKTRNCYNVDEETIGQFTGLHDNNGKEIYEGDILKLADPKLKIEWNAVVEFGNPNCVYDWGYQLKPISNKAIIYGYNLDILCWVEMEDVNVYCEIIGNIYQRKPWEKTNENN